MEQKKRIKVSLVVALCLFMEMLDSTIVTTATPSIAQAFGVTSTAVSVTITAYMTTLAVFIPLSGWMAERYNRKKIFLLAIAIFALGSMGCAWSLSFPMLVVMRIIQGIGGSMMVPVGRLIVLQGAPKKSLIRIVSYLVWPGLVAPAIAPLVGGLIVTYASWHWIFMINVPIGLIAFIISWRLVESNKANKTYALDWIGFILLSIGAGGLVYGANLLSDSDASWSLGVFFLIVFMVEFILALVYMSKAKNPLIKLNVMHVKSFRISQTGGSLFWFSVGAAPYLMTLLFQNEFGWSATFAGMMVLFIFLGNIGIKPASTYLLNHLGFKTVFVTAITGVAGTMLLSGFFTENTPYVWIALIALLSGMGRSLALTSYNTISFSELDPQETRNGNTLAATTQNMAQAVGIAIVAIVIRIGDGIFGQGSLISYQVAFFLLAFFAVISLVEILALPRDMGDAILESDH